MGGQQQHGSTPLNSISSSRCLQLLVVGGSMWIREGAALRIENRAKKQHQLTDDEIDR
jgi:hypothetical protein